jgi:hypothetical protein
MCWLQAQPENTGLSRGSPPERLNERQTRQEQKRGTDGVHTAHVRSPFFAAASGQHLHHVRMGWGLLIPRRPEAIGGQASAARCTSCSARCSPSNAPSAISSSGVASFGACTYALSCFGAEASSREPATAATPSLFSSRGREQGNWAGRRSAAPHPWGFSAIEPAFPPEPASRPLQRGLRCVSAECRDPGRRGWRQ